MELIDVLVNIQQELNAPKTRTNKFSPSKFKFRNADDIMQAVKPLLSGAIVLLNDEIVQVGDRYYVKATAKIQKGKEAIEVSAFARECLSKKSFDEAQITGSCSSYARKYALNGLFLIDDNKCIDSQDNGSDSINNSNDAEQAAAEYQLDDNTKEWIKSAREDRSVLDKLIDPGYRKFIEENI